MNKRERILLALTIAGSSCPTRCSSFLPRGTASPSMGTFDPGSGSLPAAQLVLDLGIAFVAFALWAAWEAPSEERSWWLPFPATLWWDCAPPCPYSCCCASALSSPRTPAVARVISSSSYGALARQSDDDLFHRSEPGAREDFRNAGPGGNRSLRSASCPHQPRASAPHPPVSAPSTTPADRTVPAAGL